MTLRVSVESYSGYKADQRPLRFSFTVPATGSHAGQSQRPDSLPARTYEVREILDQWYGVGYQCFKVRADDDNLYILRHDTEQDAWSLDSFRRAGT